MEEFLRRCVRCLGALGIMAGGMPFAVQGAPHYDWVLSGARVMDPATGFDAQANVGLTGNRIAAITDAPLEGRRTVAASGLVLAPGFIDTHYHGTLPIHYRLALRNGVTTAMDLEFGTLGDEVADWYAERAGTSLINFGTASSHELARAAVLDGCGPETRPRRPQPGAPRAGVGGRPRRARLGPFERCWRMGCRQVPSGLARP